MEEKDLEPETMGYAYEEERSWARYWWHFFSRRDKGLAKKLARAAEADLLEIAPKIPYTPADLDWRDSNARSTIEMKDPGSRPEIAGVFEGMEAYERCSWAFPFGGM